MLRDQGPKSRDLLCALLTLHTFMDPNGFAYPSLRTWAKAARMSTNTLTKHYKAALRDGWLAVEVKPPVGQAWRRNSYRAALPLTIQLPEKDEILSDALISQYGDIENDESCVTQSETPSASSCLTYADTPSGASDKSRHEGVSNGDGSCLKIAPKLSQNGSEGVSNDPERCLTAGETEVLKSEVLKKVLKKVLNTEGAVASDNTATGLNAKPQEATKAKRERIRKALDGFPDWGDNEIAKIARVSLKEVQQVKAMRG